MDGRGKFPFRMKHPLAIFHHSRLSGGRQYVDYANRTPNIINPKFARSVFLDQMKALVDCGLYENANEIILGVNAAIEDADGAFVEANHPPGSKRKYWGADAESLLPTMRFMQEWAKAHPNWYVLFFHTKSVNHAGDPLFSNWRLCSEKVVLRNWRQCVKDLDAGFDASGPHWLTPEQYGENIGTAFFGGGIFWVTAKFLCPIPLLPEKPTCTNDWYKPEHLVGSTTRPNVANRAPHWPNLQACGENIK
jgi:hypothetical protein